MTEFITLESGIQVPRGNFSVLWSLTDSEAVKKEFVKAEQLLYTDCRQCIRELRTAFEEMAWDLESRNRLSGASAEERAKMANALREAYDNYQKNGNTAAPQELESKDSAKWIIINRIYKVRVPEKLVKNHQKTMYRSTTLCTKRIRRGTSRKQISRRG